MGMMAAAPSATSTRASTSQSRLDAKNAITLPTLQPMVVNVTTRNLPSLSPIGP